MQVNIKDLEKQLLSRIDTNDLVQVEKVERYIRFVESSRRMSTIVEEEGESVTTENGSQRFIKPHPLLGEINKANASLLNIEKSFPEKPKEEEPKYSKDDLI